MGGCIHRTDSKCFSPSTTLIRLRVGWAQADLQPLADKVSGAWTAFARTGNPSQPGLPWPRYSTETRPTMIFNNVCKIVNDPAKHGRMAQLRLPAMA